MGSCTTPGATLAPCQRGNYLCSRTDALFGSVERGLLGVHRGGLGLSAPSKTSSDRHAWNALARDDAPAHVNARGAHGVVLHDFLFVEEDHQCLLVSLGATMHQIDVGYEVGGLRLKSRELVLPGF